MDRSAFTLDRTNLADGKGKPDAAREESRRKQCEMVGYGDVNADEIRRRGVPTP